MSVRRLLPALALALGMLPLALEAAHGQAPGGAMQFPARAGLTPGRVSLAEPVRYRGLVLVPRGLRVQWLPPDTGGVFAWGALTASRSADRRRGDPARLLDTLKVETTLQAFAVGNLSVPGLRFRAASPSGDEIHRLPVVRLLIVPTVPADSAADLKPVRGPLAAPWWERVPWPIVGLVLAVLAALAAWIRWRRRRRPVAVPAVPVLDPAAAALAELAAMRRLHLPDQGRFAEHVYHLTRIVRRFLEATEGTPKPGDSTPELVDHLTQATLTAEDVTRLEALLRAWDRVKFARASSTVDEAQRAEQVVEDMIRRRAVAPAERKVA